MNRENIRIIISGGGTGGHIFPAVSIADALKKKYPDIIKSSCTLAGNTIIYKYLNIQINQPGHWGASFSQCSTRSYKLQCANITPTISGKRNHDSTSTCFWSKREFLFEIIFIFYHRKNFKPTINLNSFLFIGTKSYRCRLTIIFLPLIMYIPCCGLSTFLP